MFELYLFYQWVKFQYIFGRDIAHQNSENYNVRTSIDKSCVVEFQKYLTLEYYT